MKVRAVRNRVRLVEYRTLPGTPSIEERLSGIGIITIQAGRRTPNNLVWAELASIGPAMEGCCAEHESLLVGDIIGFDMSDTETPAFIDGVESLAVRSGALMAKLGPDFRTISPLGDHVLTYFDEAIARRAMGERLIEFPAMSVSNGLSLHPDLLAHMQVVEAAGKGVLRRRIDGSLGVSAESRPAVKPGDVVPFEPAWGCHFLTKKHGKQTLVRAKGIHLAVDLDG